MMYNKEASRKDGAGVVLPASMQKQRSGKWRATLQLLWAAGIVLATNLVMSQWDVRPLSVLLALAVAVVLAALVSGRRGAWLAIAIAAVLGAMRLPPSDTMYIDSSYRLGYGLFLALCLLITLYRPPRSSVPLERTSKREGNRQKPYSENDLPTLAPHTRGAVEKQTCEVAGLDIYKWERACAHLSDVIADARIKLQENDQEQLYYLLKHAHQLANETRKHIQKAEIFTNEPLEGDATNINAE